LMADGVFRTLNGYQLEPAVEEDAKNHFCRSTKVVQFRKGVL
jgi:hypothetical protein